MNFIKSAFALLQKIGKSFMLPVSVLPVAGLLLGIGSAHFGWMPTSLSTIMAESGGAIFSSLPLIFAISVAIGLTDGDGAAALAATVGFVVLLASMGVFAKFLGQDTSLVMGMKSVDTGVLGGTVMGAVSAFLFKKYYRIQLPPYLGFFAGKRFVLIISAIAAIGVGGLLTLVWHPIQLGINVLSHDAAYGNPTAAATLYGFVERLLVPFGLHHIWNVPFFFEIGSYTDSAGKVVHGDIQRFFAGDRSAGILGGAYLFKMWGLPAGALAIWRCAKPDQRAKVGSIMISAALTSFLTGITEPVEFSFLFLAPGLYLVHAVLAGCCQLVFGLFHARLGFTFSQGFFDYIFYYSLDTKPWLVLIFGPLTALVYYGVFRAMILGLDLKTPGREIDDGIQAQVLGSFSGLERAVAVLAALGGRENIASLDACITRLRVELRDMSKLNAAKLKELGASGVMTVGKGVQAVFGPLSENLKSEIEIVLQSQGTVLTAPKAAASNARAAEPVYDLTQDELKRAGSWAAALGGAANIVSAAPCAATRLRVLLKDATQVDESSLILNGVEAVARFGKAVHLIVGAGAPRDAQAFQAALPQ